MNKTFVIGLALGMLAALLINVGKGVQKQKVHVFLHGRKMFAREHRGDLLGWLIGLAMTTTAIVPYTVGLKLSESPSAVSAMTGIGLIGLTIYAMVVIGERLKTSDAIGIGLVVVGTSVLGWYGGQRPEVARNLETMPVVLTIAGLVAGAAVGCVSALIFRRIHGVMFGLAAGMWLGTALFLGDAALVRAGGSLVGQLSNPYPYLALVFGALAMVTTQFGFIHGRALEVVPAVNSAAIVTPLALEVAVYGQWPSVASVGMIGVIFAGVFLLSTGTAAKVSA